MTGFDFRLQRYALLALVAAALFGASTPFAKLLLDQLSPVLLAGLLYLGSGLGLAVLRLLRPAGAAPRETALKFSEWGWLAGAIVAGGILAPLALLWGLSGIAATEASMLLNFEGVITALVAALVFREAVGGRVWLAAAAMLAGGCVLAYDPAARFALSPAALGIVAACLGWAIDNNLTRRIAGADPVVIAMTKGLVAGAFNTGLGLVLGGLLPLAPVLAGTLVLGFVSYGVSLVLFVYALRHLGSARAGAHFSTAPFIGAALAVPLLGEPVTGALLVATLLMALATWLVLTESHAHPHTHERMTHAHRHVHDEHHQHAHRGDEGPEPHAHLHTHEPLVHAHAHLPDLHHRHGHGG